MPIVIPPIVYWIGLAITALACGGGERPKNKGDGCAECHTSPREIQTSAFNVNGRPVPDAHRFHLSPRVRAPLGCADCHPVPQKWGSPTHPNKMRDVTLDGFDGAEKSCVVYCHGDNKKSWPVAGIETPAVDCVSCHKETSPKHSVTDTKQCYTCHDKTVDEHGNILLGSGTHMNGAVDVNRNKTCVACHGEPPASHLQGLVENAKEPIKVCANCHLPVESPFKSGTHQDGVASLKQDTCTSCHPVSPDTGAHETHIQTRFFPDSPITCGDCHKLPLSGNPPNQSDLYKHATDKWVRVVFSGMMATNKFDMSAPDASYSAGTCSVLYCHGGNLPGGSAIPPPVWTDPSGRWKTCGACHGVPPVGVDDIHYTEDTDCTVCHLVKHDGKVGLQ